MSAALEHLETDFEAAQKAGRLHADTRIALASLSALAQLYSDSAAYVASAVSDLPVEARADLLNVAARFLSAQRHAVERLREKLHAAL